MAVELNNSEKAFLNQEDNKKLLQKNDIVKFYKNFSKTVKNFGAMGDISALFLEVGVDIWRHLTTVVKYMFYGSHIETIIIPEGITKIEDYAFGMCGLLSSVTIPNTIKEIGNNAFYATPNLKTLYIPESVTSIGAMCFGESDIKLTTPRRGVQNKLFLPKNEIDWYKEHLVFIDEKNESEEQ